VGAKNSSNPEKKSGQTAKHAKGSKKPEDSKEKPEDSKKRPGETKKGLIDPSDVGKANIDRKGYDKDWVHEWKSENGTNGSKHVTSWHKGGTGMKNARMGLVLAVATAAFGLGALGID